VRHGPGAVTARDAVWMATREGARALGRSADLGQLTAGYRADVTVVRRDRAHLAPHTDPFSAVVYGAMPSDVVLTLVDGDILVEDGALTRVDLTEVLDDATRQARALAARSGL
jgi:5-methylthioadenosine/S-adenosylhomocysteine deaminase